MKIIFLFCISLLFSGCSTPRDGVYHTVQKGETLYRISRAYGVDERYLARLNGVDDPSRIETGQLIYVPSATQVLTVSPNTPASQSRAPSAPIVSLPLPTARKPVAGPHSAQAIAKGLSPSKTTAAISTSSPSSSLKKPMGSSLAPSANSSASPAPKADRGKFSWPARGRILKNFGTTGLQSCQGIEISVPSGTPILAASEGTVTYSGSGIRGYGNIIILKHKDSYFTVYAFNQKNLVRAGAQIAVGEAIALSGIHPREGQAALHFEIRRGKTAVNPIFYLP